MSRPVVSTRTLYVAEPPPVHRIQPPVVVDCSVVAAVIFDEPARDDAARLISEKSLHAPYLLDHEIASVASKKRKHGWLEASVERALADYLQHDVVLHRTAVGEQVALAQRYELSAYDAGYLWLAAELKAPLVTFDQRLGEAAREHLARLG